MARINPRISRREMLQSGAFASVFAASGGPVLARGQRGGRLRAALSGGTRGDSWDMRNAPGLFMLAAGQGAVFETLTEVAADGTLRGELAEGWVSRDGGAVWEIDLRPGVSFHDGRTFTSADVIATFEAHGATPALLADITRIEARGAHGLRFVLAAPNANFPYALSHPQLAIQPAGAYGSGVGTGLYQVAHFAPGARFLGTRVDAHWKGTRAGFFDDVEFLALTSEGEQRAALKAGVVDVASDVGQALPQMRGLRAMGDVAMTTRVQTPARLGHMLAMDNARFAERWWLA
ncbi:ABC transporter substrate-binding protein [Roseobacteraceae bacterium S113]